MTNQDRINKYIKEYCKNCKNKDTDLCEIKVFVENEMTITKCCYYERNK